MPHFLETLREDRDQASGSGEEWLLAIAERRSMRKSTDCDENEPAVSPASSEGFAWCADDKPDLDFSRPAWNSCQQEPMELRLGRTMSKPRSGLGYPLDFGFVPDWPGFRVLRTAREEAQAKKEGYQLFFVDGWTEKA